MANLANVAATIHANMCNDEGFGYSWEERHGTSSDPVTWNIEGRDYTVWRGDYDCSSSVCTAWQAALEGTPYEGRLDGATYTGNMLPVFTDSGLFSGEGMDYVAQRGDIYLNIENHTAMCQSSSPDELSEFSSNEYGGAYGGQRGDQTGWESHITGYYNYPWDGILRYNGAGDEGQKAEQVPGDPVNDAGFWYQAHIENLGWCDWVRDGQVAGTTGFALRLEALKIDPPEGVKLRIKLHIQNIGWVTYDDIVHGNQVVIGTTGQALRVEAIIIEVLENTTGLDLQYRVHQENAGWKNWTENSYSTGSDGQGIRLEAIQMKMV